MEQQYFDGILVEDVNIIHDSTKEAFRSPLGAVPCGTEVTLTLQIDKLEVESVTLQVLNQGDGSCKQQDRRGRSLCLEDTQDTRTVPFCLAIGSFTFRCATGTVPMVLWYWFEVRLRGGAVCYYGADLPYASGLGRIYRNPPPAFQLTVYDPAFTTPDWVKTSVMYQIFPDRFCAGDEEGVRAGVEYHRNMGRDEFELHENWEDLPVFEAKDGRSYYMPSDIFGGDLEGIRKKLPYLKELGATLLYLNPIFEAASNHRYNTGDYLKIDPVLGDAESFRRLAEEARESGIRIILDGVFSHTGDDSIYFNKYGRYPDVGAYQSKDSPYFSWFNFENHPDKYESWWGFETLPEVNEFDRGWQDFIITAKDSVIKHWIEEGALGYRLDVADELPDEIIELIRTAVKEADPEAFLLGEVWEDATTKQSYGRQRAYALGRGLDSVMNYPFLNKTIEFLTNKIDSRNYCRFLTHQLHTHPAPMYFTLMNLISSHDVSRARTILSSEVDTGGMSRQEQALFSLSEEEFSLGGRRQRLAAAIQFSLPGVPSLYYGDENGMTGLLDPFNRRAFAIEDKEIAEWYRYLARTRHDHPVMSTGYVRFFSTDGSVLGILRYAKDGKDFFGAAIGTDAVLTIINPVNEPRRIVIELEDLIEIDMPPLSAEIIELNNG